MCRVELLFADDAILAVHSKEALRRPMTHFAAACSRVRPHHHPEENKHYGPRRQYHPCNLHWRSHPGCGRKVHLPQLQHHGHLQQSIPGRGPRAECEDRQSNHRHRPSSKEGVGVWDNTVLTLNTTMRVCEACMLRVPC